nr:LOB domain-containing protein 25-like [Lolium perenne]
MLPDAAIYDYDTPRKPPWTPPPGDAASPPPSPPAPRQSCAACKHQRRLCTANCILAPYFPADCPTRFRNAHRLFGVKNILRLLEEAGPENRDDCARSIIYESNARAEYPVHGCGGIARSLEDQWEREAAELDMLRRRLAACRETCCLPQPQPPYPPCVALPLATATHEPKTYDEQGHARKKMMRANGQWRAEEDEVRRR